MSISALNQRVDRLAWKLAAVLSWYLLMGIVTVILLSVIDPAHLIAPHPTSLVTEAKATIGNRPYLSHCLLAPSLCEIAGSAMCVRSRLQQMLRVHCGSQILLM